MKIIDENGIEVSSPNLAMGWLENSTQTIHHDAVEGVAAVSHYETVILPDGTPAIYFDAEGNEIGRDVEEIIDTPGVEARDAYDEDVPVQIYHPYTEDELTQIETAQKAEEEAQAETERKQAEQEALPQKVKTLEIENAQLKERIAALQTAQDDTDTITVEQEYRLTLLELGVTDTD